MAAERMIRAADDFPAARGLQQQALNQLARELLLAQASDWPFIITTGTMSRYAGERVHDHLVRFNRLLEQVYSNRIDAEWLKKLQGKDNIFPQLDYRVFAPREKTIKIKAAL
jgi:1,4-alpha-glucan branching enzyme